MLARGVFPFLVLFLLPGWWPAAGQEADVVVLGEWGDTLTIDPRVNTEIAGFPGLESVSMDSLAAVSREIRSLVFSTAVGGVETLRQNGCVPSTQVSIGDLQLFAFSDDAGHEERGEALDEFERSLIRIEVVACFQVEGKTPGAVLDLYTSPEFRMVAESRIDSMWIEPWGNCVETRGVMALVDPTSVCNQVRELRSEILASQHSQVVSNELLEGHQRVFFKESLKTFVAVPEGIALHYINFTRAADLGRIERWAAPGRIKDSQERNIDELRSRLGGSS